MKMVKKYCKKCKISLYAILTSVNDENILKDIKSLFFDSFNRPNKTPLHLSAIQRRLEEKYNFWNVTDGLKKLTIEKILQVQKQETRNAGTINFYYPVRLISRLEDEKEIRNKIKRISRHIERYSRQKNTDMLGRYLHALVRKELKIHGFEILSEGKVKSYQGKSWIDTRHSMDIIAKHTEKKKGIGVEIKNTLDPIEKGELEIKIKLCKKIGVIPVFACRWLEPYKKEIVQNDGFPWQFREQIYPIGQEQFVEEMKKKFKFPIEVRDEIPEKAVKEFENWLSTQ